MSTAVEWCSVHMDPRFQALPVPRTTFLVRSLVPLALAVFASLAHTAQPQGSGADSADTNAQDSAGETAQDTESTGKPDASTEQESAETEDSKQNTFELTQQVNDALLPLFKSIADASVSRATIELSAESSMKGTVIERQSSTYHVASEAPDKYTVYLKEPDQRTRGGL